MVFGFMKQSGGHINVYSEPGRGTTFRLYLRPAQTRRSTIEVVEAPPLQPVADSHETILVVEDNAKLRQIVREAIERLGFQVLEVDNAKRALELLALKARSISCSPTSCCPEIWTDARSRVMCVSRCPRC